MDEEIKDLDPDESQFTTMLMKVSSGEATREKINWLRSKILGPFAA